MGSVCQVQRAPTWALRKTLQHVLWGIWDPVGLKNEQFRSRSHMMLWALTIWIESPNRREWGHYMCVSTIKQNDFKWNLKKSRRHSLGTPHTQWSSWQVQGPMSWPWGVSGWKRQTTPARRVWGSVTAAGAVRLDFHPQIKSINWKWPKGSCGKPI